MINHPIYLSTYLFIYLSIYLSIYVYRYICFILHCVDLAEPSVQVQDFLFGDEVQELGGWWYDDEDGSAHVHEQGGQKNAG